MPDGRGSVKTKQHFPSQVNDSKHIKLDGGQESSVPLEMLSDNIRYVDGEV